MGPGMSRVGCSGCEDMVDWFRLCRCDGSEEEEAVTGLKCPETSESLEEGLSASLLRGIPSTEDRRRSRMIGFESRGSASFACCEGNSNYHLRPWRRIACETGGSTACLLARSLDVVDDDEAERSEAGPDVLSGGCFLLI
jgi:hypothetical protein